MMHGSMNIKFVLSSFPLLLLLCTHIAIRRNADGDITKEFFQIAVCITGPSYKSSCDTVHANVINDMLQPKIAATLSAKNKYPPLPTSILTSLILLYCF